MPFHRLSPLFLSVAVAACATATAPTLPARLPPPVAIPNSDPRVRSALEKIRTDDSWLIEQQTSICEVEAPSFKEQRRAADFAARFRALGYANVRIDAEGNVIAERPGDAGEPVVVLSAHLDTVFPEGTDVRVRRSGDTLRGPGIGDNCRGLAVLLGVARSLDHAQVRTTGTIIFVATVGEEGAGNLRGVRHLVDVSLKDRIDYSISVDGAGLSTTSAAVGSNRYRVTYSGPGGHSYGAFGMPNPMHALGRAIALVSEIQVPTEPRTTFSVGVLRGGTSVNSISESASMDVDLRSESPAALAALDSAVMRAVASALGAERARWPRSSVALNVKIDTIGIRPAATQPDTAPIVRAALEAARTLGFSSETGASSTDANLPMSRGIPAITIDGGGIGRGAHSLNESWIATPDAYLGPQWALLITLTLAGVR
ncbi:MAG: M20/M25/M40 family metallo-hydrolase [Gemmatimonadaceae bacterium]|nr:M20/M25/M40 family metallo-hydrolase [Gemmatimonadaceae bacterium]